MDGPRSSDTPASLARPGWMQMFDPGRLGRHNCTGMPCLRPSSRACAEAMYVKNNHSQISASEKALQPCKPGKAIWQGPQATS
eukprot:1161447-Pelagomonas_calceolata.AAC.9